jgi:hypothetical protein
MIGIGWQFLLPPQSVDPQPLGVEFGEFMADWSERKDNAAELADYLEKKNGKLAEWEGYIIDVDKIQHIYRFVAQRDAMGDIYQCVTVEFTEPDDFDESPSTNKPIRIEGVLDADRNRVLLLESRFPKPTD